MHIPFPEQLSDVVWSQKWAQVKYLADSGVLGAKFQKQVQ